MIRLKHFFTVSIVVFIFSACNRPVTLDSVAVIKKFTHVNTFYEFQYLSIPDSTSLENLRAITKEILVRDGREHKQTIYNYYIGKERKNKFAVFSSYHAANSQNDTVVTMQYGHLPGTEYTEALTQINDFKSRKQYVVSDSCFGIWRNWANPFTFYLILLKKDGKYYAENFNPDFQLGMKRMDAKKETDFLRVYLAAEHQEYSSWEPKEKKSTYRYALNEFDDLYLTDQYGNEGEYMVGIYNLICHCDNRQNWDELK